MPQTNVDVLAAEGMIVDPASMPPEAKQPINALSATEVQQLITMWKRVGSPKPKGKDYMVF